MSNSAFPLVIKYKDRPRLEVVNSPREIEPQRPFVIVMSCPNSIFRDIAFIIATSVGCAFAVWLVMFLLK